MNFLNFFQIRLYTKNKLPVIRKIRIQIGKKIRDFIKLINSAKINFQRKQYHNIKKNF
jgi:hypothetical protein